MELPARVFVTCQILGFASTPATLVDVRSEGVYELRLQTQDGKVHAVLVPAGQTGLVFAEPELEVPLDSAIER